MKALALVLGCVFLCAQLLSHSRGLNILSFNVRQFGVSKYGKQEVVDVLVKIVQQYDLVLIMELTDVSQTVWPGFVEQLNQNVSSRGLLYDSNVSERVGRSHIKEQYAFLYRSDAIKIVDTFQYGDPEDVFEREPYAILVDTTNESLPQFFIVASHTRPSDAVAEINALDDVFDEASLHFSTDRGMILGDLNADCSYVSRSAYSTLDLIEDDSFTWWISSDVDTTTGSSDCAYDRIITSSTLSQYVLNDSVHVVLFDEQYSLSEEETQAVSDHYPVHVSLQGTIVVRNVTVGDGAVVVHNVTVGDGAVVISPVAVLVLILLSVTGGLTHCLFD